MEAARSPQNPRPNAQKKGGGERGYPPTVRAVTEGGGPSRANGGGGQAVERGAERGATNTAQTPGAWRLPMTNGRWAVIGGPRGAVWSNGCCWCGGAVRRSALQCELGWWQQHSRAEANAGRSHGPCVCHKVHKYNREASRDRRRGTDENSGGTRGKPTGAKAGSGGRLHPSRPGTLTSCTVACSLLRPLLAALC